MGRTLQIIRRYHSMLGFPKVVMLLLALWLKKLPSGRFLFRLRTPTLKHPVYLRFGTTDAWVFKEVLLDGEYDFLPPILPKIIIDAGANIGLSSIFFANKFPEATIYALEPEESNFQLLERNASAYPRIKPLKMALWSENKFISLVNPTDGHWGFKTVDNENKQQEEIGPVQAITLDALMDQMSLTHVDVLKIDIEGAEKEVFESSSSWIGKIQIIMAELHDRYRPGCSEAFHEATKSFQPEIIKGQTVMRLQPAATK